MGKKILILRSKMCFSKPIYEGYKKSKFAKTNIKAKIDQNQDVKIFWSVLFQTLTFNINDLEGDLRISTTFPVANHAT